MGTVYNTKQGETKWPTVLLFRSHKFRIEGSVITSLQSKSRITMAIVPFFFRSLTDNITSDSELLHSTRENKIPERGTRIKSGIYLLGSYLAVVHPCSTVDPRVQRSLLISGTIS